MSKGTILSGGTAGQYSVSVSLDTAAIAARITALQTRLASLQADITTAEDDLEDLEDVYSALLDEQDALIDAFAADPIKDNLVAINDKTAEAAEAAAAAGTQRARLAALVADEASTRKEITLLSAAPATVTTSAWCADLTEDLAGDVGLIEVPGGERGQHLQIRPGHEGAAAYSVARDGGLRQPFADVPAATTYNLAMLPGWQTWLPRYRLAQINSIDAEESTCSLTIASAISGQQGLGVNYATAYSAVPIEYMTCDHEAFADGDIVVVEFIGQTATGIEGNWAAGKLKVIGFASNPQPCGLCEASEVIPPLTEDASNPALVGITESDGFTGSYYYRRGNLSNWGDRCFASLWYESFDNYNIGVRRYIYDCETALERTDLTTLNNWVVGGYVYTGLIIPLIGTDYLWCEFCNGTTYNRECSAPGAPDPMRQLAKLPPIGSSGDVTVINSWTIPNSSLFSTRASLRDTFSRYAAFYVSGATPAEDSVWSQAAFYVSGQDPIRKVAGYYLEGRNVDGSLRAEKTFYRENPTQDMDEAVYGSIQAPEMGTLVQDTADGSLISVQVDSFVAGLEEEELWYTLNLIDPTTGAILNAGSQPRISHVRYQGTQNVEGFDPSCSIHNKNLYFGTRPVSGQDDGNLYISQKITSWYSGQSIRWSQNRVYSVAPASGRSSDAIVLPEQNRIVWRGDDNQSLPEHSRILQLADVP